jgi:hypothetical protein
VTTNYGKDLPSVQATLQCLSWVSSEYMMAFKRYTREEQPVAGSRVALTLHSWAPFGRREFGFRYRSIDIYPIDLSGVLSYNQWILQTLEMQHPNAIGQFIDSQKKICEPAGGR